jgi:Domain of unknown function (DUF4178)
MTPPSGSGLNDPRVGQTLSIEGREWEVTDHSSYWSDEGYRVTEWCCESGDTEAYLLKEVQEGSPTRWFFTRSIPKKAVGGLPGGSQPSPPQSLTYEGRTYRYAETTQGTYEQDPGNRERKATWEYWDDGRQHNLAVEVWADGRIDCYHGAYIEPSQVQLIGDSAESERESGSGSGPAGAMAAVASAVSAAREAKKTAKRPPGNPFVVAMVMFPLVYLVPFFFAGRPFDECLAIALPIALLFGWLSARRGAPGGGWIGLLGLIVVAFVFRTFHPISSTVGLATLLSAPAAVGWWGRRHAATGRRAVVYLAAFVVGLPALALGFYYYFWFAPGPHGLGQLALALGPAALGAVAAMLISGLILATAESGA